MFTVFHVDPDKMLNAGKLWGIHADLETWTDHSDWFTKMAVVECDTPEQAFELTNHIDSPWPHNKEIRWIKDPVVRSTSVGDVLVDTRTDKVYLVASIGFEEITL